MSNNSAETPKAASESPAVADESPETIALREELANQPVRWIGQAASESDTTIHRTIGD